MKEGLYVDELITGGETGEQVVNLKETTFSEGGFELHKWHSNLKEVEKEGIIDELTTNAKEQLGTTVYQTKILGLL